MEPALAAAERRKRQGRTRLRNWRRSLMDCGEDGCGECRVCRRFEFEEYVNAVAPRDIPWSALYDPYVVAHIRNRK